MQNFYMIAIFFRKFIKFDLSFT